MMVEAYTFAREEEINKIASAVAKAWGAGDGRRRRRGRDAYDEEGTDEAYYDVDVITTAEEFEAFAHSPEGIMLGLDRAKAHPVEKPTTAPGVDPAADKAYLRRMSKVIDQAMKERAEEEK